jgi:heterodisulfide reductase subunit C
MDIPPHLWVYRFRNGDAASVKESEAIWQCLSCFCCAARCPRGVQPVQLAEEARQGKGLLLEDVVLPVKENMPQQLLVATLRKARG